MNLSKYIYTFGQYLLEKYGERVHKIAVNANLSCPNRDGTKGIGGCSFCNNVSFNPAVRERQSINNQLIAGREIIHKRIGAKKFIAYFQAYTNTYGDYLQLKALYDQALQKKEIIGLSVGTRPDCVPDKVLDLLADYQQQGYEVWLELGLQSAFDKTLDKVNRGHGYGEYLNTIRRAQLRQINICTHLIIGLPGENSWHYHATLKRVIDDGVNGLKLHPLHVVKGTQLARQWKQALYRPLSEAEYVQQAADLIEMTPKDVVFHRITATAAEDILLAPAWCSKKWRVLNAVAAELQQRYEARISLQVV